MVRTYLPAAIVVALLSYANVLAQLPMPTQVPVTPRPQMPVRDGQAPSQKGTAVIKGRITAADTGRPLRRSRITASSPELGQRGRDVSTDAEGRYEIRDLPAGRYSLTVTRSGYLRLRYGQTRPLEQGRQLDIADGQTVQDVDFVLPKMSVIAGRVTDELGDPIEGASVFAMRMQYWEGRRRVIPGSQTARTDDEGEYRITGLMPGAYWVMATTRDTWAMTENGKTEQIGYAPTYLPGTTTVGQAIRIAVGVGEQVRATGFSLVPGRAAKVSGMAVDSRGRPLVGGNVSISQEMVGTEGGSFMGVGGAPVAPDGAFVITNVPPGEFKIRASAPANREPGAAPEVVTQVLIIDGQDVDGIRLMTTSGWSLKGRVRTETGDPVGFARNRMAVTATLLSPELEPKTSGMFTSSQIYDDWTFSVTNIFAPSRVQVTVPDGWAVKSVLYGDRDVADAPLDAESGGVLSDVEVVVTNRVTRLSGQLANEKGAAATQGTVVLFATNADKWFDRSRWIRAVRPNQQAGFQVVGLPSGEYFVLALDYVQEGVWNDPEYLGSLVERAQKVTLREGESETLSLKVVSAPE